MNDIYVGALFSEDYLSHHGILGMKWGIRRYQNEDGTLTAAGRKRKARMDDVVKKAKEYSRFAEKDRKTYSTMETGHGKVSKKDTKRWADASVAKKQYYDGLVKKYSTKKLSDISEKDLKKVEKELKYYAEAEFEDYYFKGKVHNLNLKDK